MAELGHPLFPDGGPHRQPDRRRLCPLCLGLHSGSRTGGRRGSGAAGRRDGGTAVSGLSASPGFGRRRHFDPDCRHGVPGHCLSAKALGAAGAGGRDGTGGRRYLCAAILRPAEPRRPLCRSIGPDRRFRPLLHPAVPAGGGPAGPGGAAVFRGGPDAGFRRPDHLECLRGPGPAVRPAGLHCL